MWVLRRKSASRAEATALDLGSQIFFKSWGFHITKGIESSHKNYDSVNSRAEKMRGIATVLKNIQTTPIPKIVMKIGVAKIVAHFTYLFLNS